MTLRTLLWTPRNSRLPRITASQTLAGSWLHFLIIIYQTAIERQQKNEHRIQHEKGLTEQRSSSYTFHMSAGIAFQKYNGIDVQVDEYGSFSANVGGNFLREQTYDRLKARIEEELKADTKAAKLSLECYAYCFYEETGYSVAAVTLIGMNRNDSSLRFKGHDGKGILYVVPRTDANKITLTDLAATENERARGSHISLLISRLKDDGGAGVFSPASTRSTCKLWSLGITKRWR
jgi:hypothetical protein